MQNLPTEPSDRFATRAAHDRLDALFAFPHDPYRQDWEIELSDGSRLEEFFIAYESQELTEDERFALMALVVASAHDALDFHNLTDGQWQVVHELLVRDSHIHASTVYYWCCVDATTVDECFTLTRRMRDVWNAAFPGDAQMPSMPIVRRQLDLPFSDN